MLTDIVLLDVSGDDLAAQALALRPTLRVVFTSGYLERTLGALHRHDRKAQDELFGPGTHFLKKPFGQTELLAVVARAMQPERQAA
jgi:FixJ family two-component response regulator